jgi:hypothetical protein
VVARRDPDPLRVGCFGAGRPWKNQLVAAQAALAMARRLGVRLELYVNTGHWDTNGQHAKGRRQLFGHPTAQLFEVPWNTWTRFRQTVSGMDLLISPSFDETFCVICADGVAEGVPSVVTAAMDWTPVSWWCHQPHDQASVAAIGMALLHDRVAAVYDGRERLREYVELGVHQWIEYLTR